MLIDLLPLAQTLPVPIPTSAPWLDMRTTILMGAVAEFAVLKGFGTSTFFLITLMCLFDVVAGYTVSIVTARRDLAVVPPQSE